MRTLQTVALISSTMGAALMAGLFCAFAYAVMPGLSRGEDHAFVRTMQHINRAIINGWFLVPFLLPLPGLVLATVLAARGHSHGALPWIVASLLLYGSAFLVTGTRNVPLNEALDQVEADAGPDRLRAARNAFEAGWVRWNKVRAVLHTASLGALVWALHLHGAGS
ncbi:anthrone oxygenase family protein [Streptomyces sp. NPDC048301]|uniref:anthrone oxygenase family protein n=1 Tax=unclassified Streptomyces TaxID=2593676 RepID=UPI00341DA6C7